MAKKAKAKRGKPLPPVVRLLILVVVVLAGIVGVFYGLVIVAAHKPPVVNPYQ